MKGTQPGETLDNLMKEAESYQMEKKKMKKVKKNSVNGAQSENVSVKQEPPILYPRLCIKRLTEQEIFFYSNPREKKTV